MAYPAPRVIVIVANTERESIFVGVAFRRKTNTWVVGNEIAVEALGGINVAIVDQTVQLVASIRG